MYNVAANLYECLHCKGEGTCRNGEEEKSCAACIKRNELKGNSHRGLICGSCGGIGKADPVTERIDKRTGPVLALFLACGLLFLITLFGLLQSPLFPQILAFASAIIGSIVGFYFSGKGIKS